MFDDLNYGDKVSSIYIDFDYDDKKSLLDQIDILKEDIIQVQYTNGLIIDVGWYPEFSINGSFKVYIIKDCKIINEISCANVDEMLVVLKNSIEKIKFIE